MHHCLGDGRPCICFFLCGCLFILVLIFLPLHLFRICRVSLFVLSLLWSLCICVSVSCLSFSVAISALSLYVCMYVFLCLDTFPFVNKTAERAMQALS